MNDNYMQEIVVNFHRTHLIGSFNVRNIYVVSTNEYMLFAFMICVFIVEFEKRKISRTFEPRKYFPYRESFKMH